MGQQSDDGRTFSLDRVIGMRNRLMHEVKRRVHPEGVLYTNDNGAEYAVRLRWQNEATELQLCAYAMASGVTMILTDSFVSTFHQREFARWVAYTVAPGKVMVRRMDTKITELTCTDALFKGMTIAFDLDSSEVELVDDVVATVQKWVAERGIA